MKRVGKRCCGIVSAIVLLTCASQSNGITQDGLTVDLLPGEVRPGDIIRMEVTRTSGEYAEFHLDVPVIENLHLIATEQSPVTLRDGQYTQSETWIFQTDRSGDIPVSGLQVTLVSDKGEKQVTLPPMVISVLPYHEANPDPKPLEWSERDTETSATIKTLIYVSGILLAAALHAIWNSRRKRKTRPQEDQPDLLADALADLDNNCLNPDSLQKFYARSDSSMSSGLRDKIERAIFANRGTPSELATAIRKEFPS